MVVRQCYRTIDAAGRALWRRIAWAYLRLHGVRVESDLRMYSLPICRRHPQAAIELGRSVVIHNKLRENLAGVSHRTVLVANCPQARLMIGNHVGISGATLFCSREIVIEDHVNIGAGAILYDTDFHPIPAVWRRKNKRSEIATAPVRICEDAWIGANVTVLKGVTIGARSVVGTGAVVTRDIPADVFAAGVPARVVRVLDRGNALD